MYKNKSKNDIVKLNSALKNIYSPHIGTQTHQTHSTITGKKDLPGCPQSAVK
jgi:hypothetical protein